MQNAQLKSTHFKIKEIAASLNFPNLSYFGKYFKRHTGTARRNTGILMEEGAGRNFCVRRCVSFGGRGYLSALKSSMNKNRGFRRLFYKSFDLSLR